jgi:hypothetical protein
MAPRCQPAAVGDGDLGRAKPDRQSEVGWPVRMPPAKREPLG